MRMGRMGGQLMGGWLVGGQLVVVILLAGARRLHSAGGRLNTNIYTAFYILYIFANIFKEFCGGGVI